MVLRRGNVYYTNFVIGGRRVRQTTGTPDKALAEQAEARLKQALWAQQTLGERPARSWKEAVLEYALEKRGKRTLAQDLDRLDKLTPTLATIPLHQITHRHIERAIHDYERRALSDNARGWRATRGLSPASRNRYRAVAQHLLRLAEERWDWIERAPKLHLEREPREEARWLTPSEAEALLGLCTGLRAHWRAPIGLGLSTGLRAGNIFGLQWHWVDLPRRTIIVPRATTKTGRTYAVPLNDYAIDVIRGEQGKHPQFVITCDGEPYARIAPDKFKRACRAVGIEGATFHSLRHTWAAWHIMAGTPLYDVMVMGGWTSLEMLSRTYGHLSTAHLAASAERIVGTKLVTQARGGSVECLPSG